MILNFELRTARKPNKLEKTILHAERIFKHLIACMHSYSRHRVFGFFFPSVFRFHNRPHQCEMVSLVFDWLFERIWSSRRLHQVHLVLLHSRFAACKLIALQIIIFVVISLDCWLVFSNIYFYFDQSLKKLK